MMFFDTVMVTGGNIDDDFALCFLQKAREACPSLLLIAVDHGMDFLARNDVRPDLLIGDLDSAGSGTRRYIERHPGLEVIRLNPMKDDTDTHAAFREAVLRGAQRVAVLGGTGTRLDHVLANVSLLLAAKDEGISVTLLDPCNLICMAEDGMTLRKEQYGDCYISFSAPGREVKGLTLEGFVYPVTDLDLTFREGGLMVSNEIRDECARIRFREGDLVLMITRDKQKEP